MTNETDNNETKTIKSKSNENENKLNWINKNIILKTFLFCMIFYILTLPLITIYIKKIMPFNIEIQFIQALLFGFIYYIITINDL